MEPTVLWFGFCSLFLPRFLSLQCRVTGLGIRAGAVLEEMLASVPGSAGWNLLSL